MSHEHDEPEDAAPATAEPAREPRAEPIPDFLARARRILGGDIRPEDYLPVTPEVEERVKRDLAFGADHIRKQFEAGRIPAVFEPDPCVAIRQRNQWLLSLYYGGQNIACIENETGVIVLAVGLDESAALINAFPYEQRKDVGLCTPDPPDTVWM
jgi:hypothetical protein